MQNVFPKWFHQSASESRSAYVMDCFPRNRAYLQTKEAYQQAINEIKNKLGTDRLLFLRAEELHGALQSREEDWVYRQAFSCAIWTLFLCPTASYNEREGSADG